MGYLRLTELVQLDISFSFDRWRNRVLQDLSGAVPSHPQVPLQDAYVLLQPQTTPCPLLRVSHRGLGVSSRRLEDDLRQAYELWRFLTEPSQFR